MWNPFHNLAEGIHKIKYKYRFDNEKCETCGIKYKNWEWCLEHKTLKDDFIENKYLSCN